MLFRSMSNLAGVSRRSTGRLPYRCTWSILPVFSGDRVAHFTFVTLYVLFWLFYVFCRVCLFSISGQVFVPGLYSFDFRYNLGSLITLLVNESL